MTGETSIRVLRTISELEEIRKEWESWPGHRDSDLDYFVTVLRSNPGTLRPHVLVASHDGRPDCILVGRIDRTRIQTRIGYLRVNPKAEILYFVYGAQRGNSSDQNCELLVNEVLRSLSCGEADAAYMNFLEHDSTLYRL